MKLHEMFDALVWELRADRLDAAAARVGATVEPAVRLSGSETWIGPAADDARFALGTATRATREAAVALRRAAAMCRSKAEAARAAP